MIFVLDEKNDDDVVRNNDVGVSVGDGSINGGNTPHGLRFFRCHYRGNGSFSGSTIMMLLSLSLLPRHCRCCCRCHFHRCHGRRQCPRSVNGGVIYQ